MQEVIIDNKQGLVVWNGKQVPRLLLRMIRGAVGKSFVVKHYRDKKGKKKIVVTRYPEMQGVVASEQQRVRRDLFREAVVYARWIIGEEERKRAFRKTLPRKKRRNVYQAALQLYMRMQGDAQWLRKQLAVRSMMQSGRQEMVEGNRRLHVVNGSDGLGWTRVWNGLLGAVYGAEQQGVWRIIWKKDIIENVCIDEVEQDVGKCCLVDLRV